MRRPTYSEIQGKIRQAKEAITREEFRVLKPSVVARDALELGIQIGEMNSRKLCRDLSAPAIIRR
jgi:hypothetical protein